MTKRQFGTLCALIVTLIVTQFLCALVLVRGQERTRKAAEAAQASAHDVLEVQKDLRASADPDAEFLQRTRRELSRTNFELEEATTKLIEMRERRDTEGADLEKRQMELANERLVGAIRHAAALNGEVTRQNERIRGETAAVRPK